MGTNDGFRPVNISISDVKKGSIFRIYGREIKESSIMFNIYLTGEKRFHYIEDIMLGCLCRNKTDEVEIKNEIPITEGKLVLYSQKRENLGDIRISIYNDKNELVIQL